MARTKFNTAEIMRQAHAEARDERARWAHLPAKQQSPYARLLRFHLKAAWADARRAAMSERDRRIADLQDQLQALEYRSFSQSTYQDRQRIRSQIAQLEIAA